MDMHIVDADIDTLPPAEAERALRIQLAAAYRLVDHFGWTELIYGHLTVRVPGPDIHFLINPFGLNYDEVTASNLVKIGVDGNVVEDSGYPVNQAGFVIHSAVHLANAQKHKCVLHTHTRAGMAICAIQEGLRPVSMFATAFHEAMGFHDYEGPSLDTDERERILESLGEHNALILRNHGMLVTGATIPEAFLRLYRLERACQIQLDAAAAGTLNELSENAAISSREAMNDYKTVGGPAMGRMEFQALMRKLDKIDPSYRD